MSSFMQDTRDPEEELGLLELLGEGCVRLLNVFISPPHLGTRRICCGGLLLSTTGSTRETLIYHCP